MLPPPILPTDAAGLVSVNVIVAFVPVTTLVGANATVMEGVAAARPVPLNVMLVGLVGALELMMTVPLSAPVALGAKTILSTQLPPGAMLIGEPVLGAPPAADPKPHQCAVFGGGPPVLSKKILVLLAVISVNVRVAVPLLVMVIACGALDVLTEVFGKAVLPVTVTAGAAAAEMLSVTPCVATGATPLDACTVKALEPAAVGVPVNAPVDGLSAKPAGNAPATTLQVIGVVPVAVKVCVYGVPTAPAMGAALVMVGGVSVTAAGRMNRPKALGKAPTATVAITVLVAVPITETFALLWFAT